MDTENAKKLFEEAAFIKEIGCELVGIEKGFCESKIKIEKRHLQQSGVVHAGVIATMADHSAATAAATYITENQTVMGLEFKINLLRPAQGEYLICRASILKAGKTISVAEADIFSRQTDGEEKLVAKAIVSLAIVHIGNL